MRPLNVVYLAMGCALVLACEPEPKTSRGELLELEPLAQYEVDALRALLSLRTMTESSAARFERDG